MRFETERLILRPWEEEDAEDLYRYAKDPRVGPMAGWPIHTDIQNSLEIIRTVLSDKDTYAVCLKEDNRAIGSIGLFSPTQTAVETRNTELEIGYWIGVPFWGKGYIPEAIRALQEYAFSELGCTAMWCGYYDGNEKSRKCQEKCGFTYHHTENDRSCLLMNEIRTEHFTRLDKIKWQKRQIKKAAVYIHGKGGNAEEASHYEPLFPDYTIFGFDYKSQTPWEAAEEFHTYFQALQQEYASVVIIANSLGACFSLYALKDQAIEKAYFISPIVDMERLILDMMQWAGVTEEELMDKKKLETSFGETLSWEYLIWIREHPVTWNHPTSILYGSTDQLQSIETLKGFASETHSVLTVMENGEHFFHTDEQMAFLDAWIQKERMEAKDGCGPQR